jgi:hypothetical protein
MCALALAGHASGAMPLQTAVYVGIGDLTGSVAQVSRTLDRLRRSGATAVRLTLSWKEIAPVEPESSFKASDPSDPEYDWTVADKVIKLLVANRLTPLVNILTAPAWAEGSGGRGRGTRNVSSAALGNFATAIARRYSGSFEGLPRVRYWLVWNEPNLSSYLAPQRSNKRLVGATRYRNMVNAFATSVHVVRQDNVVVAGLLSPFTYRSDPGPLEFMRAVLCMSSGSKPKPTCSARTQFDVWSVHPYTSGGPTHHAFRENDVSLGDLPEVRRLLNAAGRSRHVVSRAGARLWVTEFSWDSKPPDPQGVPLTLEAHWIAQGLYQMWKSGVSLVTWFLLTDLLRPSPFQSGLFFASGNPKPALQAYRFPLVAFRRNSGVYVWGRTPNSQSADVAVQLSGKGWRRIARVRAGAGGIFSTHVRVRARASDSVRAVVAGSPSLSFPLKRPGDMFVNPFGS